MNETFIQDKEESGTHTGISGGCMCIVVTYVCICLFCALPLILVAIYAIISTQNNQSLSLI